ncbi:MAG: hypothetical protein IKA61_07220 [Clostridia bacterium]|nr:hypothetical protein [Clostridia bacterium]
MKKKKISLICTLLSIAVAFAYLALAIVLVYRTVHAKEYVPTADSNLWIMNVLKRLKDAGFNIFFSIMGIVLSVVLALYRFTLAYFYFKIFKSDDVFYKARLGEIVFFSVLAGGVIAVTAWLCWGIKGVLPVEVQPFVYVLFFTYIFLCSLPLFEIIFVFLAKLFVTKPTESVPTRKGIMQELDDLADKAAEEIVGKQAEREEVVLQSTPVTVSAAVEAVKPRVRQVAQYVTPFWDVDDDLCKDITTAFAKSGIRKKRRKPSYSSAALRIKKSISRKKRLKIMSPAKIRLRYKKADAIEGVKAIKRK